MGKCRVNHMDGQNRKVEVKARENHAPLPKVGPGECRLGQTETDTHIHTTATH